jgi:crotonobetainyl-CoA:carnitine CoA-transferase CaiB-like acyl-CoA transferase
VTESSASANGALHGVRVLDLSRVLAGPYCSMMLGDLGADVVKVERPGAGDETRQWGPPFVAPGLSAYFVSVNRSKRSIAVDLKHPQGVALVRALARAADVLIENFTPGTAERLGIGYPQIRALNPRLVYCSITGFGPDGPYRGRPGYDLVVSAIGGLMGITGERDGPPVKVGVAITDVCTGLSAQGAICAALYARERTGAGQRVDLSLLETQVSALVNVAASFLASGSEPRRWGTAHETIVPYQGFDTADEPLIVAVGNDHIWGRFCAAIGQPDLARDPRFVTNPLRVQHREACVAAIAAVLKTKPRDEWVGVLNAAGVPSGPINSLEDVFADPQVLHRGMLVELEAGDGTPYRAVGLPVKYSSTPASIRRAAPRLGEHTEVVLRDWLGYDDEALRKLRDSGAFGA